jgi:hypothetical protein
MMERLVVLVEEESAEAALSQILPKLLPESEIQIIRFQGKHDMLQNLLPRLRGLKSWLPDNWTLLVLIDRDQDDCKDLKKQLEAVANQAGLVSKSAAQPYSRFQVVNRIVVEELESWFFGDWEAVHKVYPKVPRTIPAKEKYRDPDAVAGGTWEALERILRRAGYFESGLRKIELARSVSMHMDPNRNKSRSFQVFREAIEAANSL